MCDNIPLGCGWLRSGSCRECRSVPPPAIYFDADDDGGDDGDDDDDGGDDYDGGDDDDGGNADDGGEDDDDYVDMYATQKCQNPHTMTNICANGSLIVWLSVILHTRI